MLGIVQSPTPIESNLGALRPVDRDPLCPSASSQTSTWTQPYQEMTQPSDAPPGGHEKCDNESSSDGDSLVASKS